MSIEAIVRVLGLTVGDGTRKLVLLAHANHAHADGTASWVATDTVARYAECSGRSVQRHRARLVADGHLREGDQRFVMHLRGDRRPIVYDVAMSEEARAAWAEEATRRPGRRNVAAEQGRLGAEKTNLARGDTLSPRDPGSRGDTGDVHGATPVTSRGDTSVGGTVLEPSLEPSTPSLRSGVAKTINRGTRLPDGWTPDDDLRAWTREAIAGTGVDPWRELEQFRDHWAAAAGRTAVKLDWRAAWRTWIRNAKDRAPAAGPAGRRPSTTDQRVAQAADVAARFRAMEAA